MHVCTFYHGIPMPLWHWFSRTAALAKTILSHTVSPGSRAALGHVACRRSPWCLRMDTGSIRLLMQGGPLVRSSRMLIAHWRTCYVSWICVARCRSCPSLLAAALPPICLLLSRLPPSRLSPSCLPPIRLPPSRLPPRPRHIARRLPLPNLPACHRRPRPFACHHHGHYLRCSTPTR